MTFTMARLLAGMKGQLFFCLSDSPAQRSKMLVDSQSSRNMKAYPDGLHSRNMGIAGLGAGNHGSAILARTTPATIEKRIRDAFTRQAERETKAIEVRVQGSTAVLRGSVQSLSHRMAAQGAALSMPGITRVNSELRVSR